MTSGIQRAGLLPGPRAVHPCAYANARDEKKAGAARRCLWARLLVNFPRPIACAFLTRAASASRRVAASAIVHPFEDQQKALLPWEIRRDRAALPAFFEIAHGSIISCGIRSVPMVKCSRERWRLSPPSLSAGTSTTPRLSTCVRTPCAGRAQLCPVQRGERRQPALGELKFGPPSEYLHPLPRRRSLRLLAKHAQRSQVITALESLRPNRPRPKAASPTPWQPLLPGRHPVPPRRSAELPTPPGSVAWRCRMWRARLKVRPAGSARAEP
jgi:hypothetical protein